MLQISRTHLLIRLPRTRRYQSHAQQARYSSEQNSPSSLTTRYMPQTAHDDEQLYIITLHTDTNLHEKMTSMRQRYFPKHLNKLPAHLTLFHALPESRLESDVLPALKTVTEQTASFPITAGAPFMMPKGIGIAIPKLKGGQEARSIHEELRKRWSQAGFLSVQDSRHGGAHYTIMNKVDDPAEVQKAFDEVKADWTETPGTAIGLALWQYDHGYWKSQRLFSFRGDR